MRHPLDRLPPGQRRALFLPFLALTLLLMLGVMWPVDLQLRTPASPQGIVSYELAGDVAHAGAMLDAWDEPARRWAAFSLGIDYLFMAAYSTTIAFGCLWAGGVLAAVGPALGALGPLLAWGSWVAALLDAGENAALAVMLLGGGARAPWPAVAWWCAVKKFGLLVVALLYVLAAAGVRLARRRA